MKTGEWENGRKLHLIDAEKMMRKWKTIMINKLLI